MEAEFVIGTFFAALRRFLDSALSAKEKWTEINPTCLT